MVSENLCTVTCCDRPTHDGWYVCQTCADELTERLTDFGWMLDELDLVVSLQTKYAVSAGRVKTSDSHPLIVNLKASEQRSHLVNAIASAARLVIETHPEWREDRFWQSNRRSPNSEYTACAVWLSDRISGLRLHPLGGVCRDEIMRHWVACEWVIDRPPERRYLGECQTDWQGNDCGGRIYQRGGKPEARCDTCSGEYDEVAVAGLQRAMIEKLNGHQVTAAEAANLSTYMDLTIGRAEVRKKVNRWSSDKRLDPVAEVEGEVRFRFSEIHDLLLQDEKRRATA